MKYSTHTIHLSCIPAELLKVQVQSSCELPSIDGIETEHVDVVIKSDKTKENHKKEYSDEM